MHYTEAREYQNAVQAMFAMFLHIILTACTVLRGSASKMLSAQAVLMVYTVLQ